jgi:DNA polymerase-3 subunit gamma/tau
VRKQAATTIKQVPGLRLASFILKRSQNMSYQVLARKWRPKSFETLVGQDHVVRALTNALAQNRLHHAYLFTGTRGVGKTTLARILAKSLNCEIGITATPCGVCNACMEIDRGRFVDLIEVDAASNTQVDAMRDLLDNAQYAPTSGRFKVYIIDEVHMLSKSAFNAMLKTLEEPPAHVKFILATTDPQKVPVTVLSRCLQFNLRQMAGTSIVSHLQNILGQENIPFDVTALHLIARAASGSMRDALSLTDQAIAHGGQKVGEAEVRNMLGTVDQSYLYQMIEALLNNDGAKLIEQAKAMEARSFSFETALGDLAQIFHQLAMLQAVPETLADDVPDRAVLLHFAEQISAEDLQLYYQIACLGRRDLGLAPDEFAGFTMTLLRMLSFTPNAQKPTQTKESAPVISAKALLQSVNTSTKNVEIEAKKNIEPPKMAETITESIDAQPNFIEEAPLENIEQPSIEPQNTAPTPNFDGNWRKLLSQLKLGITKPLAEHCELTQFDESSMSLSVPESKKNLLTKQYQEKLTSQISQYFGKKIKLEFNIGGSGNTPAQQIQQEKAVAQSSAELAIRQDTFVQALIHEFDATIIPNSIKPVQIDTQ